MFQSITSISCGSERSVDKCVEIFVHVHKVAVGCANSGVLGIFEEQLPAVREKNSLRGGERREERQRSDRGREKRRGERSGGRREERRKEREEEREERGTNLTASSSSLIRTFAAPKSRSRAYLAANQGKRE